MLDMIRMRLHRKWKRHARKKRKQHEKDAFNLHACQRNLYLELYFDELKFQQYEELMARNPIRDYVV